MLKGKDFGQAIDHAIKLKIAAGRARSQAEIARHFGVRPPSVSDWIKKGAIAKERLPELWRYFSDVVGPEHWGLSEAEWPSGLNKSTEQPAPKKTPDLHIVKEWPLKKATPDRFHALTPKQRERADAAIDDLLRGYEAEREGKYR